MAETSEPTTEPTVSNPEENTQSLSQNEGGAGGSGSSQAMQKIEFTGTATEYFGIWIVNLVLSIITLGIYSAWAKVKRETYFKNNTKIVGSGLGYHTTGGQILKGRIIAFVVLMVLNILSSVQPIIGIILIPIFIFVLPWILNNSIRFSARMTSYRNVRFNWYGTYWPTFWYLVIAPIFGLLTLGLLTPLISKSYYAYFARSSAYGTTCFKAEPKVRDFYMAFLVGGIFPALALGCIAFTIIIIGQEMSGMRGMGGSALWMALPIAFYSFVFSMAFIYSVLCRNLVVKTLTLDTVASFDSTISPVKFIWISLSNLAAVLVSFGLLSPWAQVRLYRYLSHSTLIKLDGDIEKFVDDGRTAQSSIGEAIADFEGVEVSI